MVIVDIFETGVNVMKFDGDEHHTHRRLIGKRRKTNRENHGRARLSNG